MVDYRIIDADGHVMELDEELREFIGPPYNNLEWHKSYSFWPGLTMDGYLRSLRQKGGWAGGGDGPKANHWLNFWIRTESISPSSIPLKASPTPRFKIKTGRSVWPAPTTIGSTINSWRSVLGWLG